MKTTKPLPVYFPLSNTELTNDPQKILSGLGKSTKRGVKKCFRCGVYNGTRSTRCKNTQCGVVLKDSDEKSKLDLDAVKLITGTARQIYSVRVRDMGPDHRGFVQLPVLQCPAEDASILSEVALCFVDSCQRSFDDSILKCHEELQNETSSFCEHINSSLKGQSTATRIDLKKETVFSLKVSDDIKTKLCSLSDENEGPIVQRVSKSVMAVKCQVTPKQPLGYLHFTFVKAKGKNIYEKYYCSCAEFMVCDASDKSNNKCIHYYACICALASDPKYSEDFKYFINSEIATKIFPTTAINSDLNQLNNVDNNKKINIISNKLISMERISPKKLTGKKSMKIIRNVRKKQKFINRKCKDIMPKIFPIEIKILNDNTSNEECWNFLDWLTYVTESINKTMLFENCGIINTQVFYIPEGFYNRLKESIPDIYIETQTNLTYVHSIMNILHLKEIFDTPKIKLKISKKYVHNEQKGYVEYDENEENSEEYQYSFIYFLNVGQSTVDESDNTNNSFIIEWLPNISTLTKIGQLKLQYKYGRKGTQKCTHIF